MKPRLIVSVVAALSLAAGCAAAQTTPPAKDAAPAETPKPPAKRETPPDTKAYEDATRITDPAEKIAALEKFKQDFPKVRLVRSADQTILSTLVKKFPGQTDRIRKQAKAMYSGAPANQKSSVAGQIANEFLQGGLLLKDAEGYAKKSLQSMKQAAYLAEQRESYAKRKANAPSEAELLKRFRERRASAVGTLGLIYVKEGQAAKGRKLLEESYTGDPEQPKVQAALGELAAKDGNTTKRSNT